MLVEMVDNGGEGIENRAAVERQMTLLSLSIYVIFSRLRKPAD